MSKKLSDEELDRLASEKLKSILEPYVEKGELSPTPSRGSDFEFPKTLAAFISFRSAEKIGKQTVRLQYLVGILSIVTVITAILGLLR